MGCGLGLIIEIREDKTNGFSLLFKSGRAVGGVGVRVVAADGYDSDGLGSVVFAEHGQSYLNVLDKGAVGADEHEQQRCFALRVVAADGLAGHYVCERKVRGGGAEREHGGFGA